MFMFFYMKKKKKSGHGNLNNFPLNKLQALDYLGKSRGIQRTKDLAEEHANRAVKAIEALPYSDDEDIQMSRRALVGLTHRVITRSKWKHPSILLRKATRLHLYSEILDLLRPLFPVKSLPILFMLIPCLWGSTLSCSSNLLIFAISFSSRGCNLFIRINSLARSCFRLTRSEASFLTSKEVFCTNTWQ